MVTTWKATAKATAKATETTNLTADTWITIANLSGKGLVAIDGFIGPKDRTSAETVTFRAARVK